MQRILPLAMSEFESKLYLGLFTLAKHLASLVLSCFSSSTTYVTLLQTCALAADKRKQIVDWKGAHKE